MLNTFAAKGELRMREWHRYTPEFKKKAVERLKGCTNVEALARELKVSRGILYLWRDKAEGRDRAKRPGPVVDTPAIVALKKEVVDLKVALADKALETDFSEVPCKESRIVTAKAETVAIGHLRLHLGNGDDATCAR